MSKSPNDIVPMLRRAGRQPAAEFASSAAPAVMNVSATAETTAELRYRHLYANSSVAIYELDLEGRLTAANPAMVRMFGCKSEQELLAVHPTAGFLAAPADQRRWLRVLRRDGHIMNCRKSLVTRDGRTLELQDTTYAVNDADGRPIAYQGTATDVTQIYELSRRLSYEATHDSLTALPNRGALAKKVEALLDSMTDDGTSHALCYLDLDQFKVVNDTFGHAAGDELLRQLGTVLQEGLPARAMLARIGGDEFAVLLPRSSAEQAGGAARDLLAAIRAFKLDWCGQKIDTTASIGVVVMDHPELSLGDVLGAADAACFTAKEKGRNRVHVQESNDETVGRRITEMRTVIELKYALDEHRLTLHRQPIRRLGPDTGHGAAFELLVRMLDSQGVVQGPGQFLPAAEKYNLSSVVDTWVLEAYFDWLQATPGVLDRIDFGSINLSGLTLGSEDYLRLACALLDSSGIPGARVCFEITETAAINNLHAAQRFIAELKKRGCRFALDDFGSGFSSFGYLKNLPVDFIKIDGMFIRALTHSAPDRVIVKSINDVAHSLGLMTIAEFVEDEETLAILAELGVDYAQGYAIAAPEPLPDPAAGATAALRVPLTADQRIR